MRSSNGSTVLPFDELQRGVTSALETDAAADTIAIGGRVVHVTGVQRWGHQSRVVATLAVGRDP